MSSTYGYPHQKVSYEAIIRKLMEMGFSHEQSSYALSVTNGNELEATEYLVSGLIPILPGIVQGNYSQSAPQYGQTAPMAYGSPYVQHGGNPRTGQMTASMPDETAAQEEAEVNRAIEQSLKEQHGTKYTPVPEPTNPELRKRVEGMPLGFRNVGNTCYFNSLMHMYFNMPRFMEAVMNFKETPTKPVSRRTKPATKEQKEESSRKRASIALILKIQKLFAFMIHSDRKYIDPSFVIKALVDDYGNPLEIGDQKDAGEFNINFLSRLEDGLQSHEETKGKESQLLEQKEKDLSMSRLERSYSISFDQTPGNVEDGIILQYFFGKFAVLTEAVEKDKTPISLNNEALFGQIILNVDKGDLYSGWENNYYSNIEDYKTPQGFVTTALQEFWLTKLPKVLVFQITRVLYDKVQGCLEKSLKSFRFNKTIFVDRFMYENRAQGIKIRENIAKLESKIKSLEIALTKFKNYQSTNLDLGKVIQTAHDFLALQIQDTFTEVDTTHQNSVITFDPAGIGKLGYKAPEMNSTMKMLSAYANKVKTQIEEMEKQLEHLRLQVDVSNEELHENPYKLLGILVHDGYAMSGHYYAFIYDHILGVWRRYNDTMITEESEENVMKESFGGYQNCCAYCLMYLDPNSTLTPPGAEQLISKFEQAIYTPEKQEERKSPQVKGDEDIPEEVENSSPGISKKIRAGLGIKSPTNIVSQEMAIRDYYESLICTELKKEVQEDNFKLIMEIQEYKAGNIVKEVESYYTLRMAQLLNFKDKKQPISRVFQLINLTCYMSRTYDTLTRWQLLDCTLKEFHPLHFGLQDIKQNEALYLKLMTFIKKEELAPKSIEIVSSNITCLKKESKNYVDEYKEALYCNYLMEQLLNNNWTEAIKTISFYMSISDSQNDFHKIIYDLTKVLLLRYYSEVNRLMMDKKYDDALTQIKHINAIIANYLKKTDNHGKFVWIGLNATYKFMKDFLTPEMNTEFEKNLKGIEMGTVAFKFSTAIPQALKARYEIIESEDMYQWREGWKEGAFPVTFLKNFNATQQHLKLWVTWHTKILRKQEPKLPEILKDQRDIGIDYTKTHSLEAIETKEPDKEKK